MSAVSLAVFSSDNALSLLLVSFVIRASAEVLFLSTFVDNAFNASFVAFFSNSVFTCSIVALVSTTADKLFNASFVAFLDSSSSTYTLSAFFASSVSTCSIVALVSTTSVSSFNASFVAFLASSSSTYVLSAFSSTFAFVFDILLFTSVIPCSLFVVSVSIFVLSSPILVLVSLNFAFIPLNLTPFLETVRYSSLESSIFTFTRITPSSETPLRPSWNSDSISNCSTSRVIFFSVPSSRIYVNTRHFLLSTSCNSTFIKEESLYMSIVCSSSVLSDFTNL